MLTQTNRLLIRIASGIFLILLLGFAALAGRLATGTVSLDWAASALTSLLSRSLPAGVLTVEGAGLNLSEAENRLQLNIGHIEYRGGDGYRVDVHDVALQPNLAALFLNGRLAADSLIVEQLQIVGEADMAQRPPEKLTGLDRLIALATGGEGDVGTLREFTIKEIDLRQGALDKAQAEPSFFVWRRDDRGADLDVRLDYMSGQAPASIQARGVLLANEMSSVSYQLENVRPSDVALFVPALKTLRQQTFPISASGQVFVRDLKHVEGTNLTLKIGTGQIQTASEMLRLKGIKLQLDVDAVNQSVLVSDGEIAIGDQAAQFSGLLDYAIDDTGTLSRIGGGLASDAFGFRFPGDTTIRYGRRTTAEFAYYLSNDVVDIRAMRAEIAGVELAATGRIEFANRDRAATGFSAELVVQETDLRNVLALWPPEASPKTRAWIDKNVLAGRLKTGKINIQGDAASLQQLKQKQRPAREFIDAELIFSDAKLRVHDALPVLQELSGRVAIDGHQVTVEAEQGIVDLGTPEQDEKALPVIANLAQGKFISPPFFTPIGSAQVNFRLQAPLRETLRALDKPPFLALKNLPFTAEDVTGEAVALVELGVPMGLAVVDRRVRFSVSAQTTATSLDLGKFGYRVKNADLSLKVEPGTFRFEGGGEVNGVAAQANGTSFTLEDERALVIHAETQLTPILARQLHLGFLVSQFSQAADVKSDITFLRSGEREIKFSADLSATQLHPKFLAYIKEPGQPAQVEGFVRIDKTGAVSLLTSSYQAANDQVKLDMAAKDGRLLYFNVPVFRLAGLYDFSVNTQTQDEEFLLNILAERFDISKLLKNNPPPPLPMIQPVGSLTSVESANRVSWPRLPGEFSLSARVAEMSGAHDVSLGPVQMSALGVNDKIEKASVTASFADGTELYGELFRDTETTRRFLLQSEDTANILVGLDLLKQMRGGALSVSGEVYDTPIEVEKGRMASVNGTYSLAAFQIQKVPVLAQLLSMASLTGLSDTLSGAGLRFAQATGEFSYFDGRTDIRNGIIRGPSLGVSARGAIDHKLGLLSIGGSLVPAYALNSFFRKIPVLGPVLGGAKGEGILGVSYRISGLTRDPSVTVNPLSVLTPGFVRQIFQIGAGTIKRPDEAIDQPQEDYPDRNGGQKPN